MIKLILNIVPRPWLQKAAKLFMPLAGLFYAVGRTGRSGVECPLCGRRYRRFMPYGYVATRRNALCPGCLALERHRLLWLWLERESGLIAQTTPPAAAPHVLHIAPEACLARKFEQLLPPDHYITADLESPLAKVRMDVQHIPFPAGTFDIVLCNHVLEHVADDRRAMRELHRVTRSGGRGVLLAPVDLAREHTFEDNTITDPSERTRIFGQYDHRRIYGRDYADRLRRAGWQVAEIDMFARLTSEEQKKFALRHEILYVVSK